MEKPNQIFVNGLPNDVKEKDIRIKFEKFGEIRNVIPKNGYCFVEFMHDFSAKDAIDNMNDKMFDNSKIIVKQAYDKKKDPRFMMNRGDRGFMGPGVIKKGPQPSDTCHNCQRPGHWANQCPEEKKPMKPPIKIIECFNCGEKGHIKRNCNNPPNNMFPPQRMDNGFNKGFRGRGRDMRDYRYRDYREPHPRSRDGRRDYMERNNSSSRSRSRDRSRERDRGDRGDRGDRSRDRDRVRKNSYSRSRSSSRNGRRHDRYRMNNNRRRSRSISNSLDYKKRVDSRNRDRDRDRDNKRRRKYSSYSASSSSRSRNSSKRRN